IGGVPGGAYPCAPGGTNDYAYIYVQTMNQDMWRDFATAIGREDLLADARCKDAKTRWEHRDALNEIIAGWTRARTKHEVMATLGKAGVPCGAVLDTGEVLDDPHLNARGQIHTIEHAASGPAAARHAVSTLSSNHAGRPARHRSKRVSPSSGVR